MVAQQTLKLDDGRLVRVHDSGANHGQRLTVFWHHGSPQTGALLDPLLAAASRRDIRLLSYGRPSYGGSSPLPGRNVATAAADVAEIADALGIDRFAVMGASGGAPHALACAALRPDRVIAAVSIAGIAPLTDGVNWFAGMASPGGLRSALAGRDARAAYAATEEFDPESFIPADWELLSGAWSSLGTDVDRAEQYGPDGLIDDDVAFVSPWGFELSHVTAPVLFVQGGADRVVPPTHAQWMLRRCSGGELWLRPADGHISVLAACPVAMDWLLEYSAG